MRQIPSTGAVSKEVRPHIEALKENIEELRGIRGEKIKPLDPGTATLSDVASKVNELLTVFQG